MMNRAWIGILLTGVLFSVNSTASAAPIELPENSYDSSQRGWRYGTSKHKRRITFTFAGRKAHRYFRFRAYDIDKEEEVCIFLNAEKLHCLSPSNNGGLTKLLRVKLPYENQIDGINRLQLRQRKPGWTWGITKAGLFRTNVIPLLINDYDGRERGWQFGTNKHKSKITFGFNGRKNNRELRLKGYDVDRRDEVCVYLNGAKIYCLPRGTNNNLTAERTVPIPLESQLDAENRIEVRQKYAKFKWGITDIGLFEGVDNQAPEISGTPELQAPTDISYNFTPAASDPNEDSISFNIINKPDWAHFDESTGALSGTPGIGDIGTTNDIVISAGDENGGVTALSAFDLEVIESALSIALRTGVADGVSEEQLIQAMTDTVTKFHLQRETAIKDIFNLNANGNTTSSSVTNIDWDPSHDSVYFDSIDPGENFPVLISNDAAKRDAARNENLAMAGSRDNGARYAALGSNALHDLNGASNPSGNGNDQLQAFIERLMAWLTRRNDLATQPFNVVIAHQSDSYWFRHDANTHQWFADTFPEAVVNDPDACESAQLVGCLAGADLLVIGRDDGSQDNHGIPFDLAATLQAVKNAQASGIPVLYLQYDGGINDLGSALLDTMGLTRSDNYWGQERLAGFDPTAMYNDGDAAVDAIQRSINAVSNGVLDFLYDGTNCVNSVGTVHCDTEMVPESTTGKSLQYEFFDGAETARNAARVLDGKASNLFERDNGSVILKLAMLLADKYRLDTTYPMDKLTTDDTVFLKALFSDYAIHYARPNNPVQPDMGDFTDAQQPLFDATTATRSRTFTPTTNSEWTSTGLYVPPGKAITVRRTDSTDNTVKMAINFLRTSTRLWNTNRYSRPRYLTSPHITLQTDKTYTLSTPHGGPVYIWWRNVAADAVPFTIEFSNVLDNPLLDAFDATSIDNFSSTIGASDSDWVDIRTPYAEIHSLKSHMTRAFARQDGDEGDGSYTTTDVQNFIADLNKYLIAGNYSYAGFTGIGLAELKPEVSGFCTNLGLASITYDNENRDLCTDPIIHAKPKIQHINSDVLALCGGLCSGNPFDSGSPIGPVGWGENHEMGHNLQRKRMKIYDGRSGEVSNNIFPLHTAWQWTIDQGLTKHPTQTRPSNESAFNILQAAIQSGTPATIEHPLWVESGTYSKAFQRLSFFIQLMYTHQSWEFYTKMYLMERIFTDAIKNDTTWETVKSQLGFSNYSRSDANDMTGNDFMYITASVINNSDYRNFFAAWGVEISQVAKDQVATNSPSSLVPAAFYYVHNELPVMMPDVSKLIPLDGESVWVDPAFEPTPVASTIR